MRPSGDPFFGYRDTWVPKRKEKKMGPQLNWKTLMLWMAFSLALWGAIIFLGVQKVSGARGTRGVGAHPTALAFPSRCGGVRCVAQATRLARPD